MPMPGRQGNNGSQYRYAFNGKESDNETTGSYGNSLDFGFRQYDSRLGKFVSRDPFTHLFSSQSPYNFAGNNPIKFIDYNGGFILDPKVAKKYPSLVIVLNAISNMVENSTNEELRDNQVIQAIFGTHANFELNKTSDLRVLRKILTNGMGPVISYDRLEGSAGVTIGEIGENNPFNIDVFINKYLLDAANGADVSKSSGLDMYNGDQIAALFALYETVLHEAVHAFALTQNIDEKAQNIELGNSFEIAVNTMKFPNGNNTNPLATNFGNSSNNTLGQQQLNRGDNGTPDASFYPFDLTRTTIRNYFSNTASRVSDPVKNIKLGRKVKHNSSRVTAHKTVLWL